MNRSECVDAYTKHQFQLLMDELMNVGYVYDGGKIGLSSCQIEFLDQEMFEELKTKFGVSDEISIDTVGNFTTEHGAQYIVYDTEQLDRSAAEKLVS